MRHPIFLLVILGFLYSCGSAKKSYQSGDFESAIEKAVRKIKNDKTDDENIIYLEAAYSQLYRQTTDHVAFLKKEGRPENAVGIYDDYSHLKIYEELIRPILPLYIESKKREAQFKFIRDDDFIAAKQQAAEYLYVYGNKLLGSTSRLDARQAYDVYEELSCIYPSYKDASAKQREAEAQGTNQVNLIILNHSGAPLFSELERQITTIPTGDLNAAWVNFSNEKNSTRPFDYRVVVNVRYLTVTPDMQFLQNTYTDKKTVADGWEYVLDSKGNVMKDSLGNDIKKTKYKTISCIVTEYRQQKSSTISGTIDFYRASGNALLYSYPVDVTQMFEHFWATANGDLNALSRESEAKVKSGPAPFPTEVDMLLRVGEDLKMQLKNAVRDHMDLLAAAT